MIITWQDDLARRAREFVTNCSPDERDERQEFVREWLEGVGIKRVCEITEFTIAFDLITAMNVFDPHGPSPAQSTNPFIQQRMVCEIKLGHYDLLTINAVEHNTVSVFIQADATPDELLTLSKQLNDLATAHMQLFGGER